MGGHQQERLTGHSDRGDPFSVGGRVNHRLLLVVQHVKTHSGQRLRGAQVGHDGL